MQSLTTLLIFLLLSGSVVFVVKRLNDTGAFVSTPDFNVENCQVLTKATGPEDIQVDSDTGILYISSTNWEQFFKGEKENGGIYALDLNVKDAKPKLISVDGPAFFRPHGMNLYKDPSTGEKTLFVVNHVEPPSVEAFDLTDKFALKHRETFTDSQLISLNEVVGVGKRSFYASQDTKYALSIWKTVVSTLFEKEKGSLFYFNGKDWKEVADNIHFANGLVSSADQKTIYMGETNKMRIRVYDRNLQTGNLTFRKFVDLGAGPDNLNIDSTGTIWAAGFPNLVKIAAHLQDKTAKSPVQITKVSFVQGKPKVEKVLLSSGEVVSGITAVEFYKDKIIISGLHSSEIRICSLPKNPWSENQDKKDKDL